MLRGVSIQAGTYRLGPDDGTLCVRTGRTGAAAKAGHDLVIHVTSWTGTLDVGDDGAPERIEFEADGTSLRVQEGHGGMQALGDDDKAGIHQTIDDDVLKRQAITFRSTDVNGSDGRIDVQGELTLLGTTRPLAFALAVAGDGSLSATAVVRQSDWGMKPYSTLFGALKVADEVEVELDARLPPG
jgi:polyisoprenoid-binding protein YceI